MDLEQVQQVAEKTIPYIWEIAATLMIFVSLTITQAVKKFPYFPSFMSKIKMVKNRKTGESRQVRQIHSQYLDLLATLLTFIGVSFCLYIEYESYLVTIFGLIISVLQWKLLKLLFFKAEKKESGIAALLREDLYMSEKTEYTQMVSDDITEQPKR